MILVTGATGSNGVEIVKRLTEKGAPVRALVRDTEKAQSLLGPDVELIKGDFDEPESLRAALAGIDRAFLLTNSSEKAESQQLAFLEAAEESGVSHVVKLSQFAANANSPVRFLRYHAAVEAALQASGLTYTFLRPNLFMQGLLNFAPTIINQNAFYAAIGDAKVSVVDVRDIADAAVAALTEPGHENKIYDLTGPEALTHSDMAALLSQATNREITFVDISSDAMHDALTAVQMPLYQVDGLLEDYAHYRRGEASAVLPGVQNATGHAPRNFADFAREYADQFSKPD